MKVRFQYLLSIYSLLLIAMTSLKEVLCICFLLLEKDEVMVLKGFLDNRIYIYVVLHYTDWYYPSPCITSRSEVTKLQSLQVVPLYTVMYMYRSMKYELISERWIIVYKVKVLK